jgi:tetratricopeptide (TPR) repeat protein
MRTALLFVLLLAFVSWPAFGDPCAGVEQQLALVSKQLARADIVAAQRGLGPIEASQPDCPDAVLDRARLQAANGDTANTANAEDTFVRYNNLRPHDSQGYAYYARFLIDQGEYQRADGLSLLAIQENPDDPAAIAVRGQILDMKGQSQQGIDLLEKACQLNPDDAEARFQLGGIYDRAKLPLEAVKNFEKEVALDPFDARGWDYLALNLEQLGDVDRAEKAYKKGLEVDKQGQHFDAFLDFNYGRFLMKRNDLSASKEHLDRAVVLTPQVRAPWYERAELDLRLKNYKQARSDAEKAAGIEDPQGAVVDLQVYVLLEQIYSQLGETALARQYAELGRQTQIPVQPGSAR